jgi:DNA invertase Pin-like site-specific DNA recombinase
VSSNKDTIYYRVSNNFELLSIPILYAYSKDELLIQSQINGMKEFCKVNMIDYSDVIYDLGKSNFYDNKVNLKKLIENNDNIDIIVKDFSRLGRKVEDTLIIDEKCKENNIQIYSIDNNEFLDEYLEVSKKLKIKEKDMEM